MSTFSFTGQVRLTPRIVDGVAVQAPSIEQTLLIANGTSSGQATDMWHKVLEIAAGSSETLDLFALSQNYFSVSGALAFGTLRTLYIANTSTQASVVVFAEDEYADAWDVLYSGPQTLQAGGVLLAMDKTGWAVTNSAHEIVIANNETVYTFTGTTIEGSAVIADTEYDDDVVVGMSIAGPGIPAGARVLQKTATAVTLNLEATGANEDEEFTASKPATVVVSLSGLLD